MHLVPGRLVGRFGIEARLGAGASAQVFRVRDRRGGRLRALKVLSAPTASQRARFEREVELLRRVEHPNVVGVEGLVEVGGLPALVMEYVAGSSLAEALRAGALTPAEADTIARGVMAGVGALHAAGIVHRDLKPANILLAREDGTLVPKVADLGVARRFQPGPAPRLTRTDEALGTPPYMAPEQLRDSSRVDHRADIWALGVLLFEMFCGQRPFLGSTLQEIATAIECGPPEPRVLFPALSQAWEAALLAALQAEPDRRPVSAEAMAAIWSRAAAVDLPDPLPAPTSSADDPVSTLALAAPTLAPPDAGADRPRHNLPWEADAFVGREDELTALTAMLAGAETLVTVTGTGGVGKTRLVRRFAWENLDEWPGGVWFCDLAEARSLGGICYAVAQALDVPLPRGDPVLQLGHAINGRGRCLVILDNFEQVGDYAAATIGRWTTRAAAACFLVTSRSALKLPGERRFTLEPLAVPPEAASAPRAVRESTAAALFVARARQMTPGFALTEDTAGDVAQLMRLLDGLPLAIELAAARSRLLAPAKLLARLHQRFRVLSAPDGDRVKRQSTLRATLEWSWDLLGPAEQIALAQCSVFRGGFDRAAAEAVIRLDGARHLAERPRSAQAALEALLDASLLRREAGSGGAPEDDAARLDLLESVRAFAAAMLSSPGALRGAGGSDGEDAAQSEARHAAHFGALGQPEALAALKTRGGLTRRRRLGVELDNLLAGAARRGDDAGACCLAAMAVLLHTGPLQTGLELAEVLLRSGTLSAPVHRRLLRRRGHLLQRAGDGEGAQAHLEAALAMKEAGDDRAWEGSVLGNLGLLHKQQGRLGEARAHLEDALRIHRAIGSRQGEGGLLDCLGSLHQQQGRLDEARAHFEGALRIHRAIGNHRGETIALSNLGLLSMNQGRIDTALLQLEAALAMHREAGDRAGEGMLLTNLGSLHLAQGRNESARAHFEASLAIHRAVGNRRGESVVLGNLGNLHLKEEQLAVAEEHYRAALALHRALGDRRHEARVRANLGVLCDRRGQRDAALEHYRAALTLHEALGSRRGKAIVSSYLAGLHRDRGEDELALDRYTAAAALYRNLGNRRREVIALRGVGASATARREWSRAEEALSRGDALLRELEDARGLGRLLCTRGLLQLRQGHLPAAAHTLAEAQALAQTAGASPESELGRALAELREALATEEP